MNFDSCQGIQQEDRWGFVEDDYPAMRRATVATAKRSFWKVEQVDFVGGEIEEGAVCL